MANKLIQLAYDLRDGVTAKLSAIGNALRGNAKTAEDSASQIDRANKRMSESFSDGAKRASVFNAALLKISGAAAAIGGALAALAGGKAIFTDAVDSAKDLESAFSQVQAVSGATADQMVRMKAAAEKAKRLDVLAKREAWAWEQVDAFIASRKPSEYDAATAMLRDLRDLAAREGREGQAWRRIGELRAAHAKKPTFIKRLDKAKLVPPGA